MILVDIIVPSVNETFDFLLDENQLISLITEELSEVIARHLKMEIIHEKQNYRLYKKNTRRLLSINQTLYQSGVKDGDTLIFV